MMIEEFENYTGIYPDGVLYQQIEAEYTSGDWEDKQDFCAAYKKNLDGIATRAQRNAGRALHDLQETHDNEIRILQKQLENARAQRDAAQFKLDRELDWHEYLDDDRIKDKDYKRLAADIDVRRLTDDEAKDIVSEEFGFARERVAIIRQIFALQINKYHQIRKTDRVIQRDPLYSVSDWNYIAFSCAGYSYEMVNGELNRI